MTLPVSAFSFWRSVSSLERLVRQQPKFLPNRQILLFASGLEAVHVELEFVALVDATFRLAPYAGLQIRNGSGVMRWQA